MYETVLSSSNRLTRAVDSFIEHVDIGWQSVAPHFDHVQEKSHVLWGLGLNASLTALVTTLVIYGAYWLGISNEERASKVTFVLGVILISVASMGMAAYTTFIMLIGAHGDLFVCRPLYDAPNYPMFSHLFDKPGSIYVNETVDGIICELLRPENDSTFTDAMVINTTLATAINRCERGDSTYDVFQIERLLNVSKITDLEEYDELNEAIEVRYALITEFCNINNDLEIIVFVFFLICRKSLYLLLHFHL